MPEDEDRSSGGNLEPKGQRGGRFPNHRVSGLVQLEVDGIKKFHQWKLPSIDGNIFPILGMLLFPLLAIFNDAVPRSLEAQSTVSQ